MSDSRELAALLTSAIHISENIKSKEWYLDHLLVQSIIEKIENLSQHFSKFHAIQKIKLLAVIANVTSQTFLRYIPSTSMISIRSLVKLTIALLKCVSQCLKIIPKDSTLLNADTNDGNFWKIFVIIIGIIDQVYKHQSISSENGINTINSDEEVIIETSFRCLYEILALWKFKRNSQKSSQLHFLISEAHILLN